MKRCTTAALVLIGLTLTIKVAAQKLMVLNLFVTPTTPGALESLSAFAIIDRNQSIFFCHEVCVW
jgi:hypothetical protein